MFGAGSKKSDVKEKLTGHSDGISDWESIIRARIRAEYVFDALSNEMICLSSFHRWCESVWPSMLSCENLPSNPPSEFLIPNRHFAFLTMEIIRVQKWIISRKSAVEDATRYRQHHWKESSVSFGKCQHRKNLASGTGDFRLRNFWELWSRRGIKTKEFLNSEPKS
jgi:hypothetical protein